MAHTSKNKKVFIIILISALIVSSSICISFYTRINHSKSGNVEIVSITQTPVNPVVGDAITINVTVNNATSCYINYATFFAYESGGRGSEYFGHGKYQMTIGPFPNGTVVWYTVYVKGYNDSYLISNEHISHIGNIQEINNTMVKILNVTHGIDFTNSEFNIFANVSSFISLDKIGVKCMYFSSSSCMVLESPMTIFNSDWTNNTHVFVCSFDYFEPINQSKPVFIYYKIFVFNEIDGTYITPTQIFQLTYDS